jgi:5-methylthioadenosine/S-adenosylhomocysteine deaminase
VRHGQATAFGVVMPCWFWAAPSRTRPRRRGGATGRRWARKEVDPMRHRIRLDAGIVIAYQRGSHAVLKDGVVVVEGDRIVHVGHEADGPVDEALDLRDRLLTPGFINTHTHLAGSPLDKSLIEDVGKRQFQYSALPDMLPARAAANDRPMMEACVDFSLVELMRTGTTTVMEIGGIGDYVADAAERTGLRVYVADSFRSGRWLSDDGRSVRYEWDEAQGLRDFERARSLVERLRGRADGRIQGFLAPAQVDTCTEELLRASKEAAEELQVPLALHASQSVFEFDEMMRRHALTPIEWLARIGFLGEWTVLGHALMTAGHSWVQFAGDDLQLLADSGTAVAHCPWVFARRGVMMESFADYVARGITMTLGTDTSVQSMIEALRWAAVLGKASKRRTDVATAGDVFDAATLGGARMLHRPDLGRIAPGCKADLLAWDLGSLFMVPLRDPIRNLVYSAQAEDLHDVMVDGRWLMRERVVLGADERAVAARLQREGERMWSRMHVGDWAGRSVDEMSPPTYPAFETSEDGLP